jgi:hypothetical protein
MNEGRFIKDFRDGIRAGGINWGGGERESTNKNTISRFSFTKAL